MLSRPDDFGTCLPHIVAPPPGPAARAWVSRLAEVECPAITARRARRAAEHGGQDPIVWAAARGSNVQDVDGNIYVDLSAGFAVAGVGHAHPDVVAAGQSQIERLTHGMGDLFPTQEKIALSERLAELAPGDLQRSILGLSGSDAVEAALKTAMIATGRSRVLGFHGGYHGMGLGALGVSGYRDQFRTPFAGFAGRQELRLPYASCHDCPMGLSPSSCDMACAQYVDHLLGSDVSGSEDIAAIIVEPIQGRGGDVVPPTGWLRRLREITEERGILLIFDEIYTGFGRTGAWFACEHEGVTPDLMTVGKAMGGGFPISAVLGTSKVMDAWGASQGESIHTSTFLGNPVGCAMSLAAINVIERDGLVERSATVGERLKKTLSERLSGRAHVGAVRGRGLMLGIPLLRDGKPMGGGAVQVMNAMLERGFIVSPGGAQGDVVSLSPPFVIEDHQLAPAVDALIETIDLLR